MNNMNSTQVQLAEDLEDEIRNIIWNAYSWGQDSWRSAALKNRGNQEDVEKLVLGRIPGIESIIHKREAAAYERGRIAEAKTCAEAGRHDGKKAEERGLQRAAAIVIRRTGIPADARNPTRDAIVVLGEEIRDLIIAEIPVNQRGLKDGKDA